MASPAHHDDEVAPEFTTPQGMQTLGLDHGHEARDISFGSVFRWFLATAGLLVGSILLIWAVLAIWSAEATRRDVLPSPIFAKPMIPPEPRIQPNPVDSGLNPRESGPEYPESVPKAREQEEAKMEKYGLLNAKTREPELPERAVAAVMAQPAAKSESSGLEQPMPSASSGGTASENRLK
jgi:hypothetical protein